MSTPTTTIPPAAAAAAPAPAPRTGIPTDTILKAMLEASKQVSDLIFSPGRPPQVELSGQLTPVKIEGISKLSGEDCARIAGDLIGRNKIAIEKLRQEGLKRRSDIQIMLHNLAKPKAPRVFSRPR